MARGGEGIVPRQHLPRTLTAQSPIGQVVVVTWNSAGEIEACLRSFEEPVAERRLRLTIVDNGSIDDSEDIVRRHPWAQLLDPRGNLGYGPAINAGAEGGEEPWVIASNPDIEVEPKAIDALVGAMESVSPEVGAIAPRLLNPDGSPQRSIYYFPRISTAIKSKFGWREGDHGLERPDEPGDVEWVMGAFMAIRRSAFEQVGGFEAVRWLYGEDLDICWQLRAAGWRIEYDPSIAITHIGGASARTAFSGTEVDVRKTAAMYRWIEVRHGHLYAIGFHFVQLSGSAARVLLERLSGRGSEVQTPAQAWFRTVIAGWRRRRMDTSIS